MMPSHGFIPSIVKILGDLDLPSIPDLQQSLPPKLAWKAHVKATLHLLVSSQLVSMAQTMPSLANALHLADNIMGKPAFILTLRGMSLWLGWPTSELDWF